MDGDYYYSLVLFCIVSAISPGPNNIALLMSSSTYGVLRTIPHYLGVVLGYAAMLFIFGYGLSKVFVDYPILHQVIKYGGACFIFYIAIKIINSSLGSDNHTKGKPISFIEAVLFQWVNPKGVVIAISIISMYTDPYASMTLVYQITVITIIALIITGISGIPWLFGGAILRKLLKSNVHLKRFNIVMAVLLISSVVMILT